MVSSNAVQALLQVSYLEAQLAEAKAALDETSAELTKQAEAHAAAAASLTQQLDSLTAQVGFGYLAHGAV